MKYVIDTSFFISLFLREDVNHKKAKEILLEKNLLSLDIILNPFIIEEVFTILTYKGGKEISDTFYQALKFFNIIYSSTAIDKYINFYYQMDKKISFADASIIYDGLYYNCKLISFDKQQLGLFDKLK